jgi:hypothetical protein
LQEEAGISEDQLEFHPLFHDPHLPISELVERVPRPYSVHREYRSQRGFVKFHYAFVYVCRFSGGNEVLHPVEQYHPAWYSLQQVESMGRNNRPFDDAIILYRELLRKVQQPKE